MAGRIGFHLEKVFHWTLLFCSVRNRRYVRLPSAQQLPTGICTQYSSRDCLLPLATGDLMENILWRLQFGEFAGVSPKAVMLLMPIADLLQIPESILDSTSDLEVSLCDARWLLPDWSLDDRMTMPAEATETLRRCHFREPDECPGIYSAEVMRH